ncbi:membrane protein [Parapedobacter defluvii]|uniref:Membrane protein n=1 Tax=Parapedobacter defluvii TaxID=2045106 RepID=A0ABQ1KZF5_9SPHI|nr:RagB/SusD family nutrient uptake outer membrane protein [Parapedobacter defluvii]GGC12549.1 membrane protein [Parapedobacter defluvii]
MKRISILTLYIASLAVFLSSCSKDLLDQNNPDAITSEDLWKDSKLISLYLNTIYGDRPGWDYNFYDNIVDDSRSNWTGNEPNNHIYDQWLDSDVGGYTAYWKYEEVVRINDFLANIDNAAMDEATKTRYKGEARFMRAFLYFEMVQRYGGVPIITEPQKITDDLNVPRKGLNDCFRFIVAELDQATAELPADAPRGRVSQGAAMALKGRVLLYWASPQYFTTDEEALYKDVETISPDTQKPGAAERWEAAAKANRAVMALNKYDLYPDLTTLWIDKSEANKESIFEVQYLKGYKTHGLDALVKPPFLGAGDGGQRFPLQELVDAFPMKNGRRIGESGSGYVASNPYVGRDDRFYAFIGYNTAKTKGNKGGVLTEISLETYEGGRDFGNMDAGNTMTGYYTLKALDPQNINYSYRAGSDQPWIEFRYAEILLNYAEAANEYMATPDNSVYDAVNAVRTRAGITVPLTYGSMNKNQMRDLIRNERYVEFCLVERKRYWDIKRWGLAEEKLNNVKYHSVYITQSEGGWNYSYPERDPRPLRFDKRMYWFPIPGSELTKNPNLQQNQYWPLPAGR